VGGGGGGGGWAEGGGGGEASLLVKRPYPILKRNLKKEVGNNIYIVLKSPERNKKIEVHDEWRAGLSRTEGKPSTE
jgi:hypothetical protein